MLKIKNFRFLREVMGFMHNSVLASWSMYVRNWYWDMILKLWNKYLLNKCWFICEKDSFSMQSYRNFHIVS